MASNTPFPEFKQTGHDKHDLETDIEDLTDYCIMQNWFAPSKETDALKWTKPEKVMACLRASLSEGPEGVKWDWDWPKIWVGKWDLIHWDWDF